jgi:hypothetical protein
MEEEWRRKDERRDEGGVRERERERESSFVDNHEVTEGR